MTTIAMRQPTAFARQCVSLHGRAESEAAQELFELAGDARLSAGWRCWRFDREASGVITASFDVSPRVAGGLRRRALRICSGGIVVHLPRSIAPGFGPADLLASILEQAGSDFSIHVLRHVGSASARDDIRRDDICAVLDHLAWYACGAPDADDSAGADPARIDALFHGLSNDPLISRPFGAYLLTLARAIEAVRNDLDERTVRANVASHVAAARRRLGGGMQDDDAAISAGAS